MVVALLRAILFKNIQGVGLDVEADATAEQVFSKRPLHFFLDFGHLKVDATAQQAFFEGPEEYSRGRSGCRSRCNSGTGVFEKTPSFFFLDFGLLKVDATAEQMFSKRPLHFFLDFDHLEVDATAQQAFSKGHSEYLRRVTS